MKMTKLPRKVHPTRKMAGKTPFVDPSQGDAREGARRAAKMSPKRTAANKGRTIVRKPRAKKSTR